jgi:hypothetical protein
MEILFALFGGVLSALVVAIGASAMLSVGRATSSSTQVRSECPDGD